MYIAQESMTRRIPRARKRERSMIVFIPAMIDVQLYRETRRMRMKRRRGEGRF